MIDRNPSGIPTFRYRTEFFDCSFFSAPASATRVFFQISRRIFNAVERNYIKRRFREWCRPKPKEPFGRIRIRALKAFNIRDRSFWNRTLAELDQFFSASLKTPPRV